MVSEQFTQTLFIHVQAYSKACAPLTYAEIWNIWNPGIFRTLPLLRPDAYSEPCLQK